MVSGFVLTVFMWCMFPFLQMLERTVIGEMLILLVPYMAPLLVALVRKHKDWAAIGVVNLLLGWAMPGWALALAWAVKK